jgi:nucleoid-associated protein YgaU
MKKAALLLVSVLLLAVLDACRTQAPPPETPVPEAAAPAKPTAGPIEAPPSDAPAVAMEKPGLPAAPAHPVAAPHTAGVARAVPVPVGVVKPAEPPTPVADADVQRAREAVARARAADAAYYEPTELAGAIADLDAALSARAGDPERSRALLASAVEKANRAYQGSLGKAAADLESRWLAMDARLQAISADRYATADYRDTVSQWERAAAQYAGATGDVATARTLAYGALKAQRDLFDRLEARIASIEGLRRDVDRYLDEAEQAGAGQWAARELGETNRLYLLGVEAYQAYRLDESEEYYGAAREAARHAAAVARQNRSQTQAQQRAEAERLLKEVMAELEAASRMTVVTEDGTVILPREWSGEDLLRGLEGLTPPAGGSQSLRLPPDGSTVVLGDVYEENLLEQAKELWSKGLEENEAGNYAKAMEYFRESRRYVEVYRSMAVKAVYTIRLIPERRDCLWRIAEYDFIYGDPYLWPKIWRRNRTQIQNPDLVYPGMLLIIPPED